jgi:hypothetical protein
MAWVEQGSVSLYLTGWYIMDIEAETRRIKEHIDKGNYHAGINLAISAMNACRREVNQAGVDYFLGMIKGIVESMTGEFGSRHE